MSQDPTAVGARWAANLAGSTSKIKAGIEAVQTSPGLLAARNKAGWVSGVTASQDKWARNVGAVTLSDWQNAFVTKGLDRIASGATAAQPKMVAFLTQFLPFLDSAKAALPDRGGLEQNIARMTAMVRKTATFSYKK